MNIISSNKDVTYAIIKYVGGKKNIKGLYHCATRLRFNLIDKNKFNISELEKMPEVIAAVNSGTESQVIIGGNVGIYYQEIMKNYHLNTKDNIQIKQNNSEKNFLKRFVNTIVAIISPTVIVLTAGGMIKVIITLLLLCGLNKASLNYQILNFISNSAFYFLPFMLANNAAKKFSTNPYLAMMIAGVLLHPDFIKIISTNKNILFLGLPIRRVTYSGSVIPIILIVWIMSYIDKISEKIIPNIIKTMIKPLLIIIITAPLALIVIGPIGNFLDGLILLGIDFLNNHVNWLIPTLVGTLSPLLIMIGMHISLMPIAIVSFTKYGYENILGPGMLASNLAQAGASLAVAMRETNKSKRNRAISSGVSEPSLYGITLKHKRILACVMIAGGIAGFYSGITGVVRYSFGSPGIFTLPVFIGTNWHNFINACITSLIAIIFSFILTYFFADIKTDDSQTVQNFKSVVSGKIVPLNEVNDQVFASGSLGNGVAIYPNNTIISAPIESKVSMVFPTGHAIGLKTLSGQEILIHIGIDTTKLKGKGFKVLVDKEQLVKSGDPLVKINLDLLKTEGFDPTVIMIFINTPINKIKISQQTNITTDENLLSIVEN